jgi:hypothetical protein
MTTKLLYLLLGTSVSSALLLADTVTYSDFSSTAGLTLHDQTATVGDRMRLTHSAWAGGGPSPDRGGFNISNSLPLTQGFVMDFVFAISAPVSGGGQGFSLVFQPHGDWAIGDGSSGLGYNRIERSVAVEFDTYPNPGNDPAGEHIAIQRSTLRNGTLSNEAIDPPLAYATPSGTMMDGTPHAVRVIYTPGLLRVTSASLGVNFAAAVNLADPSLGFAGGRGWVGFMSGIDPEGRSANHDLLSLTFTNNLASVGVPEPGETLTFPSLLAIGGLLQRQRLALRRRQR